MVKLFTSYYIDKDASRQVELTECLEKNILCQAIDKIYLLIETAEAYIALGDQPNKIVKILIHERPTFDVIFETVNNYTSKDDINIIANSDIFFDESIKQTEERLLNRQAYALCRWDNDNEAKEYRHIARVDSQDTWIFRGAIQNVKGDFCMGICGCDNTLAHRLQSAGYQVSNPSLSIKTYHMHSTGIRHYDVNVKTPQPYKTLQFTR